MQRNADSGATDGGFFQNEQRPKKGDYTVSREKLKANLEVLGSWGLNQEEQNHVMLEANTFHEITPGSIQKTLTWLKTDLEQDEEGIKRLLKLFPQILDLSLSGSLQPFVAQFLEADFSKEAVIKTIVRRPRFIGGASKYPVTHEFFKEKLGISERAFMQLVLKLPQIFGYHIKRNLEPKLQYFLDVGHSVEDVRWIVMKCPQILGLSLDSNIRVKLEKLRDIGFTEQEVHRLVRRSPTLLLRDIDQTVKSKLEWITNILDSDQANARRIFFTNPAVFHVPLGTWQAKLTTFAKFGFSTKETSSLIFKFPRILQQSTGGIEAKCEFARDVLEKSQSQMSVSARYYTCAFEDSILYRSGFLRFKKRECREIALGTIAVSAKHFSDHGTPNDFQSFESVWTGLTVDEKIHTIKTGDFSSAELLVDDTQGKEQALTA